MTSFPDRPFDYYRSRARERSLGMLALFTLLTIGILAGIIVAVYFAPHPELIFGEKDDGNSAITRQVTINDLTIEVPTDKLARSGETKDNIGTFAEVIVPWPDINEKIGDRPPGLSDFSDHFILRFEPSSKGLSENRRFENIYTVYFNGSATPGPAGLTRYSFDAESPYAAQHLFSFEEDNNRIYLHCDIPRQDANTPLMCERIVKVTERVQVRMQFARQFLDQWREIEGRARSIIYDYAKR